MFEVRTEGSTGKVYAAKISVGMGRALQATVPGNEGKHHSTRQKQKRADTQCRLGHFPRLTSLASVPPEEWFQVCCVLTLDKAPNTCVRITFWYTEVLRWRAKCGNAAAGSCMNYGGRWRLWSAQVTTPRDRAASSHAVIHEN